MVQKMMRHIPGDIYMMFKMFASTIVLTTGLLVATQAPALEIDPKKALVIQGVIAQGNILPLGVEMVRRADAGVKSVDLVINSPGGSVTTGFLFLNLMQDAQSKGLKVKCYVAGIAASMAFQILTYCDERHALDLSYLLWHRARVRLGGMFGTPITAPQALTLGRDLEATDNVIFSQVLKVLKQDMAASDVADHFEAETLHIGRNLHALAPSFITPHSSISGIFESLLGNQSLKSEQLDVSDLKSNEIIYMTDRVTIDMGNNVKSLSK